MFTLRRPYPDTIVPLLIGRVHFELWRPHGDQPGRLSVLGEDALGRGGHAEVVCSANRNVCPFQNLVKASIFSLFSQ
jgi:hypothetical protein